MSIDPHLLSERLAEGAERAGPVRLTEQQVRVRVARRRRVRQAVVGAGAAGVVAVAAGVVTVFPGSDGTTTVAESGSGSRVSHVEHGNHVAGGPAVQCGATVTWPTVASWKGTTLKIGSISRADDGSPRVDVDLVSSQPTDIMIPQAERYARFLIVDRDGRVVAGQDTPARPGYRVQSWENGNALLTVAVSQAHPYRMSLQAASASPCPGLTWSQLWDGRYDLVVLKEALPVQVETRYLITRAPLR